jgi:hypothetical protein
MKIGPLSTALGALGALFILGACAAQPTATTPTKAAGRAEAGMVPLFPTDGVPAGWTVRNWADVSQDPPPGAQWVVTDGILRGSTPRGTWLVSDREYGDFTLEYEFRLAERGNSGLGLRFPASGDPAVTGMELQMVDARYFGTNYISEAWELTGALYKALAPNEQVYRPLEWNSYRVTCRGSALSVVLNGKAILDVDLDRHAASLPKGAPLSQRPRRGRIGFQELSRAGGLVEIRNARIRVLE